MSSTALMTVGLLTREHLATELKIDPQTMLLWEADGMPVLKIRKQSFYDLKAVAAWMRREGKPQRRRV
jgi:hypothetical protein